MQIVRFETHTTSKVRVIVEEIEEEMAKVITGKVSKLNQGNVDAGNGSQMLMLPGPSQNQETLD